MNMDFKAACLMSFATFLPYAASSTELGHVVLDAQWLTESCGAVPQDSSVKPSGIGAAAEAGACIGYLAAVAETAPILNRVLPEKIMDAGLKSPESC